MPGKQKIKYIQSLGQKKHRDEAGVFIAEGPKIIEELMRQSPGNIKEIYAVKEWINDNADTGPIPVFEVAGFELEKISQLKTPHSVLAIVGKFGSGEMPAAAGKITLALDTIQDPGNMGTIVRIADWFAVPQIVCSPDCADIYNPKVVQATMGSIARVNVFYTDLPAWICEQKETRKYAATMEGKDVSKMSPLREGVIIIGNEARGIDPEILALANERITISRKGRAESLNAAVAAGIILSHLAGE
jgi:TrmH family RNA methyltransferase